MRRLRNMIPNEEESCLRIYSLCLQSGWEGPRLSLSFSLSLSLAYEYLVVLGITLPLINIASCCAFLSL